jgi:hypothetical protein
VRVKGRPGYIYVLRSLHAPIIKIGTTICRVRDRAKQVASEQGADFEVVAAVYGNGETGERRLHRRFAAQQLHCEWFCLDDNPALGRFARRMAAITDWPAYWRRGRDRIIKAGVVHDLTRTAAPFWPKYWLAHLNFEVSRRLGWWPEAKGLWGYSYHSDRIELARAYRSARAATLMTWIGAQSSRSCGRVPVRTTCDRRQVWCWFDLPCSTAEDDGVEPCVECGHGAAVHPVGGGCLLPACKCSGWSDGYCYECKRDGAFGVPEYRWHDRDCRRGSRRTKDAPDGWWLVPKDDDG